VVDMFKSQVVNKFLIKIKINFFKDDGLSPERLERQKNQFQVFINMYAGRGNHTLLEFNIIIHLIKEVQVHFWLS
jgi:hypothetical protein